MALDRRARRRTWRERDAWRDSKLDGAASAATLGLSQPLLLVFLLCDLLLPPPLPIFVAKLVAATMLLVFLRQQPVYERYFTPTPGPKKAKAKKLVQPRDELMKGFEPLSHMPTC